MSKLGAYFSSFASKLALTLKGELCQDFVSANSVRPLMFVLGVQR